MDKYELLLALNDLRRTPKEEEKYLQTFAQSAKCQPQPLLKSSPQAPNN
jgi:hypothetical protein